MPVIKNAENRFCHSPWLFQPWLDLTSLNFRCHSLSFWSLKILGENKSGNENNLCSLTQKSTALQAAGEPCAFSRPVVLKMWAQDQQHLHLPGTCQKFKISWDLLQSYHQKLGEGPSNVLSQALHMMLIPTAVQGPLFRLTLGTPKWRGQGQVRHSWAAQKWFHMLPSGPLSVL